VCLAGNAWVEAKVVEYDDVNMLPEFPKIHHPETYHFIDGLERFAWKMKSCGDHLGDICRVYMIKEPETDHPIAYFVLRTKMQTESMGIKYKNFKLMTLIDFALFRNEESIYPFIFRKAFEYFWESDADVFEVISNSKSFGKVIPKIGMIRGGRGMSFKFSLPGSWDIDNSYAELENWTLTHFCGDGFSF
jgi:hypothetical protein